MVGQDIAEQLHVSPRLVLVAGFAGSGKSKFGQALASMLGAAYLDKDTITLPLVEAILLQLGCSPNDRDSATYRSHVRPLEYEALLAVARENIQCGVTTIVSAPFLLEVVDDSWLNNLRLEIESEGAVLDIIWVTATADDMRRNTTRRGAERDRWKLSHWGEYIGSIDLDMRPTQKHTLVVNDGLFSSLLNQANVLAAALAIKES